MRLFFLKLKLRSEIQRFSLHPVSGLKPSSGRRLHKIEEIESEENFLPSLPEITEKEIKEALLREVSAHFCYGKTPAGDMVITSIKQSIAFHKEEQQQAYVSPSEIPYTASLSTCDECDGGGKYECPTCRGQGWEFCPYCRGNKWYPLAVDSFEGDCVKCQGSGERTCWQCNGDEDVRCKTCSGAGEMKSYLRLLVIWTNHVNDYIVEKGSALKAHRLRRVTGKILTQEEGPKVLPLTHFPNSAVRAASVQLIQHHAFADEKVLKQRQRLSIIPVAAVRYRWTNHEGLFHVYGNEHCVYVPDYPQKCCCCNIL
ncbi:hypothetical protein JTE90_004917 [Oedothorax gibbosus]|uniref:Protein SSUH2 homolog n=1 Tax=Oedothorax gibbosus TaxID=931172 RepID=A0AAV6UKK0_9ARAC|nr:hypothetical protein JTE90_004917 [Oedothorax gibbosus]